MANLTVFAHTKPLEKVSHYTPLGIRFWDPVAEAAVTDGLEVMIQPPDRPDLARRAFRTLSGIYAFENLPSLRPLEFPDPERPAADSPPAFSPPLSARFLVFVRDRLERFLPTLFAVDVPQKGIYPASLLTSPPGAHLPGFLLFSRPTRPATATLAVVRAQLAESLSASQSRPASYAVLEVRINGVPPWLGVADERGRVAVLFPYPPFAGQVILASPPVSTTRRIQTWDVTVRVYFQSPPLSPVAGFNVPELKDILNQPAGRIYLDASGSGPLLNQLDRQIVFGQPLLLQSDGVSELLLAP